MPESVEMDAPTNRWNYDLHPGDCCARLDGDVWTVCCRECAGTGVFPVPWIDTPSQGRADMDACSCVHCKGEGWHIVTFAANVFPPGEGLSFDAPVGDVLTNRGVERQRVSPLGMGE